MKMESEPENKVVESFQLEMTGFDLAFETEDPVAYIEAQMLEQLEDPLRVLRWAVVECDGSKFRCEGAYLKRNS
jgi:hypothetical protein